jgi:phage shock protein A
MSEPGKPSDEIVDAEIVSDSAAPPPVLPDADYNEGGVPSFDYVRNRIEGRFATSVGSTELAEESPQGVSIDEQLAERERAGRDKLEEIRRSMRGE